MINKVYCVWNLFYFSPSDCDMAIAVVDRVVLVVIPWSDLVYPVSCAHPFRFMRFFFLFYKNTTVLLAQAKL